MKDTGHLVALLEFSASEPSQSISSALLGSLPGATAELDVIGEKYGRQTDLERRAMELAGDVLATGASRVALAASCAASPVLAPVARWLAEGGAEVALVAAVDPAPVTREHIVDTMGTIAKTLGSGEGEAAGQEFGLDGPAEVVLGRIGTALRGWVEDYLRTADILASEHDLLRVELLDHYLRWYSFLLAALKAPVRAAAQPVDVFLTSDGADPEAVFGATAVIRYHRYPGMDVPALARDDVTRDLRILLQRAAA